MSHIACVAAFCICPPGANQNYRPNGEKWFIPSGVKVRSRCHRLSKPEFFMSTCNSSRAVIENELGINDAQRIVLERIQHAGLCGCDLSRFPERRRNATGGLSGSGVENRIREGRGAGRGPGEKVCMGSTYDACPRCGGEILSWLGLPTRAPRIAPATRRAGGCRSTRWYQAADLFAYL